MKQAVEAYIWCAVIWLKTVVFWFCAVPDRNAKAAQAETRTIWIPCGISALLRLDENGKPAGYCADGLKELTLLSSPARLSFSKYGTCIQIPGVNAFRA